MSAAKEVVAIFGSKPDLYAILGIARTATEAQIKKAYFKKALLWHPDKAGDAPAATAKFQALSFIHAILSDKERRSEYDRTGEVEEEEGGGGVGAAVWADYWRAMFPTVSQAQVDQALAEYRGSTDERADVVRVYEGCGGEMGDMLECIIGAREEDVGRYVAIVHAALDSGEAEPMPAFENLYGSGAGAKPGRTGAAAAKKAAAKRASKAKGEAAEADELLAKMVKAHKASTGSNGQPTLEEMLAARQQARAAEFGAKMAAIEARAGGSGGGKRARLADEPKKGKGGKR